MHIESPLLGPLDIDERDILTFAGGLPAFEHAERYALIPLEGGAPFAYLQSVDDPALGFLLAYPFAFDRSYAFDIGEDERDALGADSPADLLTYCIVTAREPFERSTMNMQAPVLIHYEARRGRQIVLRDAARYPLRQPLGTGGDR